MKTSEFFESKACSRMCMLRTAACLLQIVFAGVFLLTKASAPAHANSQPASPLAAADELAHNAKVAYLQSSLDGTDLDEAAGIGSERRISTAADTRPDGSSSLLSAPVPGMCAHVIVKGSCAGPMDST
jgi:hypothetical protein